MVWVNHSDWNFRSIVNPIKKIKTLNMLFDLFGDISMIIYSKYSSSKKNSRVIPNLFFHTNKGVQDISKYANWVAILAN